MEKEMYSHIFDNSPILIAIVDFENSEFVRVNKTFIKKSGYSEEEIIGKTPIQLDFFVDVLLYEQIYNDLKFHNKINNISLRVRNKLNKTMIAWLSIEKYYQNNKEYVICQIIDLAVDNSNHGIKRSAENLNTMIERLANAVWIFDMHGFVKDVNVQATIDSGYSKEELIGIHINNLDVSLTENQYKEAFDNSTKGVFIQHVGKIKRKDGSLIDIEGDFSLIEIDGELLSICTTRDISDKLKYQTALKEAKHSIEDEKLKLRKSQDRNQAIINVLPDMLFIYNTEGYFVDFLTANEDKLLFPKSAFLGKKISEIMPQNIADKAMESIKKTIETGKVQKFEYSLDVDNKTQYFETRIVQSSDNEVLAIVRDITAQHHEQELILELSYKDILTDLYNRRYFEKTLDEIESNPFEILCILMIDVNGLKLTNDAFGHLAGDELLKKVSSILQEECPDDSIICRVGGDEFVVLLLGYDNEYAEKLVNNIYDVVEGQTVNNVILSVSIGWETREKETQSLLDVYVKAENHMFRKKLVESRSMRHNTIQAIFEALNKKNVREKIHSEQVSIISGQIGRVMGFKEQVVKEIEMTGLLHDVGKISISDSILDKPGPLTDEEYEQIKKHSESGYQILKTADSYSVLADYVLSHHERFDGKGYPRGLKGDEIPMISRIICVADAYEAMISSRPYRRGMSSSLALEEIKRNSGSQFDPVVVKYLQKVLDKK